MPRQAKSGLRPKRNLLERSSRTQRNSLEVRKRFTRILQDLASILIEDGFGIAELNQIARRAYLDAAKILEKRMGHRLSKARIAALTGLTRAEVTRLLRERVSPETEHLNPPGRAGRVVTAWCSDRRYCDSDRRARVLPFYGQQRSFSSLVKEYGGDIPPRAMLEELQRLEIATQLSRQRVQLIRQSKPISQETLTLLSAIADWLGFLAPAANNPIRKLGVRASSITLRFASLPQARAAIRELEGRYEAFLRGVGELGGTQTGAAGAHTLTIKLALANLAPRSIQRTTR